MASLLTTEAGAGIVTISRRLSPVTFDRCGIKRQELRRRRDGSLFILTVPVKAPRELAFVAREATGGGHPKRLFTLKQSPGRPLHPFRKYR